MNPLDALSALTSGQAQLPALEPKLPTTSSPIGEGFNFLQNMPTIDATQATPSASPAAMSIEPTSGGGASAGTWGHMVQQMVLDVNAKQQSATEMVSDVLRGGPTPVHQAMVATEEASLSFEFLAEMRNKVVDAYQQIMQMQV